MSPSILTASSHSLSKVSNNELGTDIGIRIVEYKFIKSSQVWYLVVISDLQCSTIIKITRYTKKGITGQIEQDLPVKSDMAAVSVHRQPYLLSCTHQWNPKARHIMNSIRNNCSRTSRVGNPKLDSRMVQDFQPGR